jgi:hypothetical protein
MFIIWCIYAIGAADSDTCWSQGHEARARVDRFSPSLYAYDEIVTAEYSSGALELNTGLFLPC